MGRKGTFSSYTPSLGILIQFRRYTSLEKSCCRPVLYHHFFTWSESRISSGPGARSKSRAGTTILWHVESGSEINLSGFRLIGQVLQLQVAATFLAKYLYNGTICRWILQQSPLGLRDGANRYSLLSSSSITNFWMLSLNLTVHTIEEYLHCLRLPYKSSREKCITSFLFTLLRKRPYLAWNIWWVNARDCMGFIGYPRALALRGFTGGDCSSTNSVLEQMVPDLLPSFHHIWLIFFLFLQTKPNQVFPLCLPVPDVLKNLEGR